jgi:hypothetical protein
LLALAARVLNFFTPVVESTSMAFDITLSLFKPD